MTISIIVGALFMAIGALALAAAFAAIHGAVRSRQWPGVPGVVLESHVESTPGVDGPGYHAAVRYSYAVQGHQFIGTRPAFASFLGASLPGRATRLVRRFPAGSPVTVFYDPENPEESVLITGFNGDVIGVTVFAVAFIALGAGVVAA